MMERKIYIELLKDPRWQKKRLEIMQRDHFQCCLCKDKETTLHVHHKKYILEKKPWEYDDTELITLCEDCHNIIPLLGFREFSFLNFRFKKEKFEHIYKGQNQIIFTNIFLLVTDHNDNQSLNIFEKWGAKYTFGGGHLEYQELKILKKFLNGKN